MTRSLKTGQLCPSRIAQAYALIRMTIPELTLEAWREFASEQLIDHRPPRGIATVENEQGYLVGLAAYRVEHDLRDNPALKADHIVAVDLIRQEEVARILLSELESLARRFGCLALHVQLRQSDMTAPWGGLSDLLAGHGHALDALCLRKAIESVH